MFCRIVAALTVSAALSSPALARDEKPTTIRLRGEVLDEATGKSLPARGYIQGLTTGEWHFPTSASKDGSAVYYRRRRPQLPDSTEMHSTLSAHPFVIDLPPGKYTIVVERGKEYM